MKNTRVKPLMLSRSVIVVLGAASLALAGTVVLEGCGSGKAPAFRTESEVTPAADSIGERLFLDTRFAQYFATHSTGVNNPLTTGDPAVNTVETAHGSMPGPFAGRSMNCRSCHFVTEFQDVPDMGNRAYADFTSRSPMPRVIASSDHTSRNAIQMVGSLQPRNGPTLLHFDGEFATPESLVKATLTGRNFGWGPLQYNEAAAQIARVIREDDGSSQLAIDRTNGLSYGVLMLGADARIPKDLRLPASQRLDVTTATDEQILDEVAMMISIYMRDLLFAQDEFGRYIGSPYDDFLRVNHLPVQPLAGETKAHYNQRLLSDVLALKSPIYITPSDGSFRYHAQAYQFGPEELAGLKIFLRAGSVTGNDYQHAGNCAACHQAPDFTDFKFHNTGVSQDEYDGVHGAGTFMQLRIPTLVERNAHFDEYMPLSAKHPNASEAMRRPASADHPNWTDLGVWNIYLNPDVPEPQSALRSIICAEERDCTVNQGLASTIAIFKTPSLRDLEDSSPYFHNGSRTTFADVVDSYISNSQLAHDGLLRNAPPEFADMHLSKDDISALTAFLKSLTEDYDDQ